MVTALKGDTCYQEGCDKPRRPAGGGRSRFCYMHHSRRHRAGEAKVDPLPGGEWNVKHDQG